MRMIWMIMIMIIEWIQLYWMNMNCGLWIIYINYPKILCILEGTLWNLRSRKQSTVFPSQNRTAQIRFVAEQPAHSGRTGGPRGRCSTPGTRRRRTSTGGRWSRTSSPTNCAGWGSRSPSSAHRRRWPLACWRTCVRSSSRWAPWCIRHSRQPPTRCEIVKWKEERSAAFFPFYLYFISVFFSVYVFIFNDNNVCYLSSLLIVCKWSQLYFLCVYDVMWCPR